MKETLYKLRNGLTVVKVPHTSSMFIIVTKNKEIAKLATRHEGIRHRGASCGGILHLILEQRGNTLSCKGGAYGTGFDIAGYKRKPTPMPF